jgi:peptidoglycan/LPS O-acetylase OafA/YrhL
VYLLTVALLSVFHAIHVHVSSLIAAGTYTWNYVPWADGWVLGHCWSLTLEEQFYLLWPACMAFFSRRANLWIASGVVLLSPLSRMITYWLWPEMRGHLGMMLHTHLDTIMTGCLLSLTLDGNIWPKFKKLAVHPLAPVAAILFLVMIDGPAGLRWKGKYELTVGFSLENLAIALLLLFVVFRHESPLGKFLNLKTVRHLGTISYSLYLWQQLFTGPYTKIFPLNLVFILLCAEASYFFIERPSFKVRDFVQQRLACLETAQRRPLDGVGCSAQVEV